MDAELTADEALEIAKNMSNDDARELLSKIANAALNILTARGKIDDDLPAEQMHQIAFAVLADVAREHPPIMRLIQNICAENLWKMWNPDQD